MIFGQQQIKCRDCKRISTSETSEKYLCQDKRGRWNQYQCKKCYEYEVKIPIEYIETFYFKEDFNSHVLNKKHLADWKLARKSGKDFFLPPMTFKDDSLSPPTFEI